MGTIYKIKYNSLITIGIQYMIGFIVGKSEVEVFIIFSIKNKLLMTNFNNSNFNTIL